MKNTQRALRRRVALQLFTLFLLFGVGCIAIGDIADENPGDDDDDSGRWESPTPTATPEPGRNDIRDGTWIYTAFRPSLDECGLDAAHTSQSDENFEVYVNMDGSVTLTPADPKFAVDCGLTGENLVCDAHLAAEVDYAPEKNAVVRASLVIEGAFTDHDTFVGLRDAVVDCEGSGCARLATDLDTRFPCTSSVDFASHWLRR